MNYYNVLLDIPTKNLFDSFTYKFDGDIPNGSLVRIKFRGKLEYGIVFNKVKKPGISISKILDINKVLTDTNIINDRTLALAEWISNYYVTPLGLSLFAMLPTLSVLKSQTNPIAWKKQSNSKLEHISGPFPERLMTYTDYLKKIIDGSGQTVLLFANYRLVDYSLRYFKEILGAENVCEVSDRMNAPELRKNISWMQSGKIKIAIGTRKSLFTPCNNLKLIIVDQPTNYGYFNDQKPAYTTSRVALQLHQLFGIDVIFGDNTPDLFSILLARRARLQLKQTKTKSNAKLVWQETNYQKSLSTLSGKTRLVVTPFLSAIDDNGNGLSAEDIAKNIDTDYKILSSRDKNFTLPISRPYTIIATKKILDYPELFFDEILIVGADIWASLPSHDATQDFITMIWQLWQQSRSKLIIQSARPIPVIESLLNSNISKALTQFMKSRQNFNLPPYTREVVIKTKNIDAIMKLLTKNIHAQKYDDKVIAYFQKQNWPPKIINEIYKQSQKILVDPPNN